MNKTTNCTNRRSARLLAAQGIIEVGGEPLDRSQTFKRKRSATDDAYVAISRLPLELQSGLKVNANGLPAPKKKRTFKESVLAIDADPDYDSTGPSKETESKSKRCSHSEPVYIIPDVEKKKTTFKGRLGYACLNTVMRNKKPASHSVFCSRTCRLESLKKRGIDWVRDLGRKNVEDLLTIIQWNEDNKIRFFRLSSEMFPFASHLVHGYSLQYCADLLTKAGALANKYGHRLTTHPGQFTQLGSPKPAVVEAACRELEYHCEMLDLMGIGLDGVIVVHGGGMYNDKTATLQRIKQLISKLPQNVRNRVVLENDEMCYNAEDLLPLCEELDVPLVFDYHHDNLFPSSIPPPVIIERANKIWKRRGMRPKQHLSEQRPGAVTLMERRAHSDRCEILPAALPDDMGGQSFFLYVYLDHIMLMLDVEDLMIEAKDKEQAVLYLHRIYDLHPVINASLRPANANPLKQTKGRKSNKRALQKLSKEDPDILDEDEAQPIEESAPMLLKPRPEH